MPHLPFRPPLGYDAPMRHFPLRELGYAIGFIVVLTALYVGAYYAMVEKWIESDIVLDGHGLDPERKVVVNYRFGGDWAGSLFSPMHALDQKLRPEWWEAF
jgi:hypothetical protein